MMRLFLQRRTDRFLAVPGWLMLGLCGLVLVGCKRPPERVEARRTPVAAKNGEATASNQVSVATPGVAHSVFSTNVMDGLDPFFPDSTRRSPKLVQTPKSEPVRPVQSHSQHLKLTGLWPSRTRPLALINKTPLGPGEEASITVTVPNGQSKPESYKLIIRCLEVRSHSVLISVDGEAGTKELVLQSKL